MKRMKKIVCFLITAMMLTAVMSLGAHAELFKDYASAADGDLLYVADFRGEDVFAPKPNILAADGVIYSPRKTAGRFMSSIRRGMKRICSLTAEPSRV